MLASKRPPGISPIARAASGNYWPGLPELAITW